MLQRLSKVESYAGVPTCAQSELALDTLERAGVRPDMIRISVCYNETNVKIGGGHAGVSVGPDGATHQALEEIPRLRAR